ncbi:MoxR family ATPase [Candidatus Pacearchaeota archaeon]|nr:MoxR family ATPase [Candidatus Pacearchaeota archaeon]
MKEKKSDFSNKALNSKISSLSIKIKELKKEISRAVVGQDQVVDSLIKALICNGHVLIEGVPGVAKTFVIKCLGVVSGCETKRVQFTVDLLPTDIVGQTIYREGKGFELVKGPIFANFLIADEINRSPPKTQSALLEAMQEKQVTIGKETMTLPKPFFVMATQNPIEQAGVYTLPEAQVDRFIFKLVMKYPSKEQEMKILRQNTDVAGFGNFKLKQVLSSKNIIEAQELVKQIFMDSKIEEYIVEIVNATRENKSKYGRYIEWGASPRASISLFIASRAEALLNGRSFVIPQDVRKVSHDVLRHRIILNYEAEAENLDSDAVIDGILNEIPVP